MFRIRRDRRPSGRFLPLRLLLVFLAIGVWTAGSTMEYPWATAVAIGILASALILGWLAQSGED